jgi:hypothetical protein
VRTDPTVIYNARQKTITHRDNVGVDIVPSPEHFRKQLELAIRLARSNEQVNPASWASSEGSRRPVRAPRITRIEPNAALPTGRVSEYARTSAVAAANMSPLPRPGLSRSGWIPTGLRGVAWGVRLAWPASSEHSWYRFRIGRSAVRHSF